MNETTGLFCLLFSLSHSAASSSALPPISPIMMMPSVSGSFTKRSRQSMKFVPLGVAADADAGRLAEAGDGRLVHGLVSERAGPAHDANLPRRVDVARHDPHLALARLDDARAVGADQATLVLPHEGVLHV